MSPRSFFLSDDLSSYIQKNSGQPDDIARSLIAETAALGGVSRMQIAPEQGVLLGMLVATIQPRLVVEVGTFTGYSSLAMARNLPDGGRLLCCDVSEEWTALARQAWTDAGVADRIDLVIAPANETLASLPADTTVDFAFIDADKGGYRSYYDHLLPRLSPHGMIAVDNTLWNGAVIDPLDTTEDTEALRAFNAYVAEDPAAEVVLLPVGDGLTLIRRSGALATPG